MSPLEAPDTRIFNRVPDENNLIVFNDFAKQIDELINLGSHILMEDWLNKKNTYIDLPAQGLFRHCLDIGDAISALIKIGSGETIKILLRNLFETNLYLEFLFEKDTEKRSLCYIAFSKISEYEIINKYNPKTPEGRSAIERNREKHPDLEQNLIIDSSLKILADIFSDEPYKKSLKITRKKNLRIHINIFNGILYMINHKVFSN